MDQNNKRSWISIIGFVILLIGIYGTLRTAVNLLAFEKYPFGGVIPSIPISFGNGSNNQPVYSNAREQDCQSPLSYLYYESDNTTPRSATTEEKGRDQVYYDNCIEAVREARNTQKIADISQSLLWLLIGAGVLGYKRFNERV